MKSVIVKVNDAVQTIAEHQVVTKDGQPTVIKATNKVNYQLLDQATGLAPDHIITKRVGKDLHVSIEEAGKESDLIIEGFYEQADSALIGQAEDGNYYYYVPDTGEVEDFVTELAAGDAEGQALGGNAYATPWWVGATETDAGFAWLPWLVGLAGLGAIAAIADDDDDDDDTPAPADVDVKTLENVPPSEEDEDGSSVITGTAAPNTTIVVKDKDGNIVGEGKTDAEGNFEVTTDKPLEDGKDYDVIAQDDAGNQIGEKDTVTGDLTDPVTPDLIAHEDGSVTAEPRDENATELTVEYTDENDQPQKVEVVKGDDGKWVPKPGTELPEGVTVDADTGKVTLSPDAVKDGSEVTAEVKDHFGKDSSATTTAGNDIEDTVAPTSPDLVATPEGGIEMTPSDDATDATVDFTDENGDEQKVEIEKDPNTGEWAPTPGTQLPPGVTVDPDTGKVTIDPDAVQDGSQVEAENSNEGGSSSSEVTAGNDTVDTTGPDAPDLVATPDGGIEMTPSDDATDATVDFTDEAGQDQTVEIEKNPDTGEWAPTPGTQLPPGVTVDPDTGKVTIDPDAVEDGSKVEAENSNGNGTSSSEITAGDDDPNTNDMVPNAPDLVATPDGGIEMTPSDDATDATVDFTDEAGQDQTVEIEKDPTTGEWAPTPGTQLPPGVTVDPDTGKVTIEPDAVEDGSQVEAENSNGNGSSSSEVTAGNDIEDTTGPDAPVLDAKPDGSVEMTPSDDADNATVDFTDEAEQEQKVEIEKDPNTGEWIPTPGTQLPDGVTVDPETGKVTIEPDAVQDGSKVEAENSNGNGSSSSEITAGNDVEDITPPAAPTVTSNADGSVTVEPDDKDAVNLTVDFTDEADQPQKVELVKGENGWELKEGTELPDGVTFDPETGKVEIHYDAVKDLSEVVASNSDEVGNVSTSQATTTRDPVNGPNVEIVAGENGVVDPSDLDEDDNVLVDITFPEDSGYAPGDVVVVNGPNDQTIELPALTQEDIDNGITVPVKPAENGEDTKVTVEVKDPEGEVIGSGSDSAPTDFRVPGDTDGDGKPDTGPVISFPEDADDNGYLNVAEDQDPKAETPVRIELPVNTEAGDIVEVVINGETKEIELTEDHITDGYVDVPVALDSTGDGKVDLDKVDVTATVKDNAGNVTPEDNKVLNIDTKIPGDVDDDGSVKDPNDPSKGDPDDTDNTDPTTGEPTDQTTTIEGAPIITFPEDTDGNGILSIDENGETKDTTPVQITTPVNTEAGDTVVVTINGEEQEVEVTEADITNGYVAVDAPVTDANGDGTVDDIEVEAYVKDPAGNESNTAKESLTVDLKIPGDSNGDGVVDDKDDDATTKDGAPIITFPEDTDGNGILSIDENSDTKDTTPVQISTPFNTEAGDTVVVTINGDEQEVEVTEADITNGYVTVDAPVTDANGDGAVDDIEVEAYVKDEAGNKSNTAEETLEVDLVVPGDENGDGTPDASVVPVVTIADGDDGQIDPEDLNSDGSVNVTVEFPSDAGYTAGDTVSITKPDGTVKNIKLTADADGNIDPVTTTFMPQPEGENNVVTAVVKDPAGNSSLEGKDESITDLIIPGDSDGDGVADVGPTVTIADGDDGEIDPSDVNDDGTVTATITLPTDAGFSAGDTLTITKPDGTTEDIVLTEEQLTNGVETTFEPQPEGENNVVTAVVKDPAGNSSLEGKDESITDLLVPGDSDGDGVADVGPTVTIADGDDGEIDPSDVNDDGTATATITLPTDAGFSAGDTLTITKPDGTTEDIVLTEEQLTNGVETTFEPQPEGENNVVTAVVKDPAGNSSLEGKDESITDLLVPGDSDGDGVADVGPTVTIADSDDGEIDPSDLNADGTANALITFPEDAGFSVGDTVTITKPDGSTEEVVLTQRDLYLGVETTFEPQLEGENNVVTAVVKDPAGNSSLEGKDESITDLIVPGDSDGDGVADVGPTVTIADGDDGEIDPSDLNDDGTATATITLPADAGFSAGDTLTITKPDGTTEDIVLTEEQLTNGVETTFEPQPEGENNVVTAVVKDPAGNSSLEGKDESITDLLVPGDSDGDGVADDAGIPVVVIADSAETAEQIDSADLNEDGTVDATVTLPTEGGYSVGDNIVIKDNAGNVLVDRKLEQADLDNGITVQVTPPADGETLEVIATVTDPQDNSAEGSDSSVVGDTTPTTAPIIDILEGNDNVIDGEDLNEDRTTPVKVYLPDDAQAGDKLVIDGDDANAITITQEQIDAGNVITSVATPAEGEILEVTAQVIDQAGNESPVATDDALVGDVTATPAPTVNIVDEAETEGQLDDADLVDGKVNVDISIPTEAVVGDTLTVTNPDGSTTDYPITQGLIDNGLTVTYPADEFTAGEELTVSAVITDQAGNTSDEGSDTTTSDLTAVDPTDPTDPADKPTLTLDLQNNIDATVDPDAPNEPVMATITGTTDAQPGSKVSIVVGEYDENGVLVPGTELTAVEAEVQDDGTYSTEVDVTSLNNTDETGDVEQDKHTIGAVATVVDSVSGLEASAEDLISEKASDAGFNPDPESPVQDVFDGTGLNNDMTLLYGPSETVIATDGDNGYVISEETGYGDPILFTNYDDTLIMDNSLKISNENDDSPNDGSNPYLDSADGDRNIITVDTGAGNDTFHLTAINELVDARIYLGEGNDDFQVTSGDVGRNSIVFTESGDDNVKVNRNLYADAQIFTGSGSDDVVIDGGMLDGSVLNLGSGSYSSEYQDQYKNAMGTSLGNDDNIDSFNNTNTVDIGGDVLRARIAGDQGKDIITIGGNVTGFDAETADFTAGLGAVYTGANNDEVRITGDINQNGRVDLGDGDDYAKVANVRLSSFLTGGSGDDTLEVGSVVTSGKVLGNRGNDTITIENVYNSGSVVSGGTEQDVITVGTLYNGTIYTGKSAESINEDNAVDIVRVNELNGGNLYLGEGDFLTSTTIDVQATTDPANPIYSDAYLQGTDIYHSNADDTLSLQGIDGGNIEMGEGNDTIQITGNDDGINVDSDHTIIQYHDINGGNGLDTVEVTGSGNNIWAGDLFSVEVVDLGKGLENAGNTFHTGYIREYNGAIEQNQPINVNGVDTKAIFVKGDAGDIVDVGYGGGVLGDKGDGLAVRSWSQTGTAVEVDGTVYDVWSQDGSSYGGPSSIYVEQGIAVI